MLKKPINTRKDSQKNTDFLKAVSGDTFIVDKEIKMDSTSKLEDNVLGKMSLEAEKRNDFVPLSKSMGNSGDRDR